MRRTTVSIAACLLVLAIKPSTSIKTKRDFFYTEDLSQAPSAWGPSSQSYLPLQEINTPDFNLKVNLPQFHANPNSLTFQEKPVMEPQEIVPPQSISTAILPQTPPPAIPVNAVASNVPAARGAVFLGSGSLGVVSLGNGAYALGSGSLGYSGNRAQPRPTGTVPVYPPLPASPNLIPAAVPSPLPPQAPTPPHPFQQIPGNQINFDHPLLNVPQAPVIDQNGYEYLAPNRIGFGSPNPRPLRIRTRQQFATPTALQLQPQVQQLSGSGYDNIPLSHLG